MCTEKHNDGHPCLSPVLSPWASAIPRPWFWRSGEPAPWSPGREARRGSRGPQKDSQPPHTPASAAHSPGWGSGLPALWSPCPQLVACWSVWLLRSLLTNTYWVKIKIRGLGRGTQSINSSYKQCHTHTIFKGFCQAICQAKILLMLCAADLCWCDNFQQRQLNNLPV